MALVYRLLSLLPSLFIVASAQAAELSGRVVGIADGDTLTVLVDRRQVRVRLADIDAPERRQPFGDRSKDSLADLCHKRPATVHVTGRDRNGRTIGRVTCAIRDASEHQVRTGMAWVYERYAKDKALYAVQEEARIRRAGLWADPNAQPPWVWRASTRRGPAK